MPVFAEKKITIHLPQLRWSSFLNIRFGIFLFLSLLTGAFGYWYQTIRPYLWVSEAHIEALSMIISADGAGRVIEMGPQEGDFVKKGEPLFLVDRDSLLAQQAEAKRTVEGLKEQVAAENERMEKALEEYLSVASELDPGINADERVKRQLLLMEGAQEKANQISAHLASAQDNLAALDRQVKKMTLAAPFSGVILKKAVNPGAVLSFGEPVYILCDPDQLWVEANIPEQQIGQIKVGTLAKILLPAYPGKAWKGKVTYISPATSDKCSFVPFQGKKESVPVRISVEKGDFLLKPGLSATVGFKIH